MTYDAAPETSVATESATAVSATALPVGAPKDLAGRIGRSFFALFVGRCTDDGLETEIARLAELSPHLLLDIGVDPTTGELIQQTELPRTIATLQQTRSASEGTGEGTTRVSNNAKVGRPMESVAA